MSIKKLNKELSKKYFGQVTASETEDSIVLSGALDRWEDVIAACSSAVDKKSGKHVVNDIVLKNAKLPETKKPDFTDMAIDGEAPDVLVIGGGISGASILRELTKWKISALLVEKESDLAIHASGRNDGEVHPGVDLSKGSLKQHYVIIGNAMYENVCRDLDVPFHRVGQFAGFTQGWLKPFVKLFAYERREKCGVIGTKVVDRKEMMKSEPNLNKKFKFALYNPTAGCVSPYNLTIAYAENAVTNGAKVSLNTFVSDIKVENGKIIAVTTNRGTVYPKVVINAAGCFAEDISKMCGDRFYSIHPRRGTNSILDKKQGALIKSIASIKVMGGVKHTKGGGILHTVHDNILVGPDAVETYEKENFATSAESIKVVFDKQKKTAPKLSEGNIITYFTGVRAPTFEEDFIIEKGHKVQNLIHCAGIQSPGLTTAPAVALDVEKMAIELLQKEKSVLRNPDFNPKRKGVPTLNEMPEEERNEYIKKNPDYGVIICRCEEISKGEIIDALNRPICVPTLDGIKKRVRPGMGRCQGGFCSPLVTEIIANYMKEPMSAVTKSDGDSVITFGETKGGNVDDGI